MSRLILFLHLIFSAQYSFASKGCHICTAEAHQPYSLSAKLPSTVSNLAPSNASAQKKPLSKRWGDIEAYVDARCGLKPPIVHINHLPYVSV